ncbi:MAG: acetylxylan esterase [Armatimonadota bacterium]
MDKRNFFNAILVFLFLFIVGQAAHADVKLTKSDDGSIAVATSAYSAAIAPDGCLQSIKAGGVEFLGRYERFQAASAVLDFVPPGCFGLITKEMTRFTLGKPELREGNTVVSRDDEHQLTYVFRETSFDLAPALPKKSGRGTFLLFAAPGVEKSLDSVTDTAINLTKGSVVGIPQEGMRWTTAAGPVLKIDERLDGYAAFLWWGYNRNEPDGVKAVSCNLAPYTPTPKYTFTPVGAPTGADALQFTIQGPNDDFLAPKGPLDCKVTATNLTPNPIAVPISFEVRDYLTRKAVAQVDTALALAGGETKPVPSTVTLAQPGPYRGVIVVKKGAVIEREVGWIFVYDFPNYHPESTRQPDFKQFWRETLDDLKKVPLDVKMTLNKEKSNEKVECLEVSLASLDGRRIWGYYCRPRKPGKYPVVYFCPPTGVYPMYLWTGDGGGEYCTFNIAIHGFDLHLSDMKPDDPWRGYHLLGISSPKTSAWRWIYASMVRCMDFLAAQPEVDAARIAVTGSSQGGGLAVVLAGLDDRVDFLYPACSGLPRLDWTVKYNTGYWPFGINAKPADQTEEQFLKTLSYFDMANFTPDIQCPVLPRIGMLDWVTASGNQICAFAHLKPGQVQLLCDPWLGHGSMSPRVKQASNEALQRFLKGEKPISQPSK